MSRDKRLLCLVIQFWDQLSPASPPNVASSRPRQYSIFLSFVVMCTLTTAALFHSMPAWRVQVRLMVTWTPRNLDLLPGGGGVKPVTLISVYISPFILDLYFTTSTLPHLPSPLQREQLYAVCVFQVTGQILLFIATVGCRFQWIITPVKDSTVFVYLFLGSGCHSCKPGEIKKQ